MCTEVEIGVFKVSNRKTRKGGVDRDGLDENIWKGNSTNSNSINYKSNIIRVNIIMNSINLCLVFTVLHEMQTRSSDENSVCLSVCPSVCLSHA